MRKIFRNGLVIIVVLIPQLLYAQAQVPEATEIYKELEVVTPGEGTKAPSDAIVLFDGTNLDAWVSVNDEGLAPWKVENGIAIVEPGSGFIKTKQHFADVQLHIEWMSPVAEGKEGQLYSNSGVFFMGKYEVQVLNSFENPTYNNGQAGSVYKQHIPLVNASKAPGTWQEYDIIFMAPKFSEKGTVVSPARITVFHNGVLIQNNVELLGPTLYIGAPHYEAHEGKLPLYLQDHGDPVQFRNIWIREL
jgi:hypothetical protein